MEIMKSIMKFFEGHVAKRFTTLLLCCFVALTLSAQTYLEHLQQNVQGLGTVSVTQSKEITDLVNGTVPLTTNTSVSKPTVKKETPKPTETEEKKEEPKERQALRPDMPTAKTDPESGGEVEVDMSKKIMKGAQKVNGYRVQAYAGGNSREAKQKANEARDRIKRAFPSEPVYVHFYSPRWICRVGNYRTQEEANRMLINIRKLGFTQAVVVKGKISVQY